MKALNLVACGLVAVALATATSMVHAMPVLIKFETSAITVQADFASVLNGAGINYQQPI